MSEMTALAGIGSTSPPDRLEGGDVVGKSGRDLEGHFHIVKVGIGPRLRQTKPAVPAEKGVGDGVVTDLRAPPGFGRKQVGHERAQSMSTMFLSVGVVI
jgi:hypothetical protein